MHPHYISLATFFKASDIHSLDPPPQPTFAIHPRYVVFSRPRGIGTYRWHGSLTLEPSSDSVINTLGLSPAGVDAFKSITLVAVEAFRACDLSLSVKILRYRPHPVRAGSLVLPILRRGRTLLHDWDVLCGGHLRTGIMSVTQS